MNQRFSLFASLALLLLAQACSSVSVNAGEEAVLIQKPIFFGHGGVVETPVATGRTYVAWTTDNVVFKVVPIRYDEVFDDIITSDNIPVDFHTYVNIRVIPGKTPQLLQNFGVEWYQNNIQQELRTEVRKEASTYSMIQLTTRTQAIDTMEAHILGVMRKYVTKKQIPLEIMGIQIGKASPNDGVMKAMNETAENQQRQKTELERAKAEESRRNSEQKRAEADNAYRNAMGLSPDQFVRLEAIKMQAKVAEVGASKGATLIIGDLGGAHMNIR